MLTGMLAKVHATQRQRAGSKWHVLANNKEPAACSPLSDPALRPSPPVVKSQTWSWAAPGSFRACWESVAAESPPQLPVRLCYWPTLAPSSLGTSSASVNSPLPVRANPASEPRKSTPRRRSQTNGRPGKCVCGNRRLMGKSGLVFIPYFLPKVRRTGWVEWFNGRREQSAESRWPREVWRDGWFVAGSVCQFSRQIKSVVQINSAISTTCQANQCTIFEICIFLKVDGCQGLGDVLLKTSKRLIWICMVQILLHAPLLTQTWRKHARAFWRACTLARHTHPLYTQTVKKTLEISQTIQNLNSIQNFKNPVSLRSAPDCMIFT